MEQAWIAFLSSPLYLLYARASRAWEIAPLVSDWAWRRSAWRRSLPQIQMQMQMQGGEVQVMKRR